MTSKRGLCRFSILLLLAGSAACLSNPEAEGPCSLPLPPTSEWTSHDEGAFTLRLPPEYESIDVQGIDSQVGRWDAPGKRVSYDFGVYSNPLQPNGLNEFEDLVVCQESDGPGTPRIILHSPAEGGYGVSAHWPGLGTQGARGTESLTLEGVVENPEDRAELLAIIHSVSVEGTASGAEVDSASQPGGAGREGVATSAGSPPPLTPEGWGSLRIGMTRAEVVAAAGEDANPAAVGGPEPEACDQFRPEQAPEGMLVMIERDTLTRITLSDPAEVATERGFRVGDAAEAIEQAYGADATSTPHKYSPSPAAYITVWTSPPPAPRVRGLVYEIGTDGRVEHIHAGGPSIQYVEGCL